MIQSNVIQVVGNPHAVGKMKEIKESSSVIMLSGGIDSVSVLKRILEETDEKIYAHHIHIKNNTGAQCKEDYNNNNNSWSSSVLNRMENGLKQLNATSYPFEVTPRRPHDNQSKRESIEYLGKELMEMIWYCREPSFKNNKLITCIIKQEERPNYQIYCCHACSLVRDALLEIKEGKE